MYKSFFLLAVLFTTGVRLSAQGAVLPRLFLDVPAIYIISPDVARITNRVGSGMHAAMNVGTHWGVVRAGGGADVLLSLQDILPASEKQVLLSPYALVEAGVGLYRSNGNQCARANQSAFTAMAKGGLRYRFNEDAILTAEEGAANRLDWTVGAEFGYFFISDVFRNWEMFADGVYHTGAKTYQVTLGTKFFLNLRASR
jgi:hypothetical protein